MSAQLQAYGSIFRDPYADLVVSHLLEPSEAMQLSKKEFEILMASVRGHMLTSDAISKELRGKVSEVVSELRSARKHFG